MKNIIALFFALSLFINFGCGGGGGSDSSSGPLSNGFPLVAEPADTRGKSDGVHVVESLELPQMIAAAQAVDAGDASLQNSETLIGQNGPASRAISAKEAGYYSGFYFSFDTTARFLDKNKNDITDVSQLGQIAEIRRERKGYVGNFSFSSSVVFDNINVAQYQRGQIWIFSAHAIHIVTMINDTTSYSCSEEYNLNCTVSFVGRTVSLAKNGVTNLNLNGWSVNLQVTNNQAAGWIKKGDVPEGSVTISGGVCAITDYETGDTITITKDSISYNVKNGAPNEFEGSWRGAWTQDTADGTVHYLIAKNGEISGTVYHRAGNVEGKIWGFATPTGRFFGYYKYPDGKVYGVSGQLLKIDDYVRANFTSVINGTPTPGVATLKNQL